MAEEKNLEQEQQEEERFQNFLKDFAKGLEQSGRLKPLKPGEVVRSVFPPY